MNKWDESVAMIVTAFCIKHSKKRSTRALLYESIVALGIG